MTGARLLRLGSLNPHPEAARRLRHALLTNGYDAERLARALRIRSMMKHGGETVDWRAIVGDDEPLTTLAELFVFGRGVDSARAEAALGPLSIPDALRAGFVERHGSCVVSPWEVMVQNGLLLLGDHPDRVAEGNVDFVGTVSNSARTLAFLTDRAARTTALDLGTGSGVQALFAAQHSDRVLGVDINARATEIATVNCHLNDLPNIEYRVGDWFEAVGPEEVFGLVVANLPFIAAPQVVFRFAHGGADTNRLSREMIRGAATRIAGGGLAQLLTSWTRGVDDDPLDAVREFADGTGCDALVLSHGYEEAAAYAVEQCGWLAPRDPQRYRELVSIWLDHYRRTGADVIEYGLITLRPSSRGAPWLRRIDVPRPLSEPCGDQIARMFAGKDIVDALADDDELLGGVFRLLEGHRLTQASSHDSEGYHQEPTTLELKPDVGFSAKMGADAAAVIFSMRDGEQLGQTVARVARDTGIAESALRVATADAIKQLLSLGMIVPRD